MALLLATHPVLTLSLIRLQTRVRGQLQQQRNSICHRLIGGGAIRWVASILRSLLPHETLQRRHKRQQLKPPLIVNAVVGVAQHNARAYIGACYRMNYKADKHFMINCLCSTRWRFFILKSICLLYCTGYLVGAYWLILPVPPGRSSYTYTYCYR